MLRQVHPPPRGGQGTDPPAHRKGSRTPSLSLTLDERRHLAASLRNLRWAYGSWAVLGQVMGVPGETVKAAAGKRFKTGSGTLAIRAAKAGGMTVEAVLGGALNPAGRCVSCGSRIGASRAAGGAS